MIDSLKQYGMKHMQVPVLLIGGRGYIGSALGSYLMDRNWDVTSLDLDWFPASGPAASLGCKNVEADYGIVNCGFFSRFKEIILLAGHSSVGMCKADPSGAVHNNLRNFIHLAQELCPNQRIIFASSASVYGRSGSAPQVESASLPAPDNVYDATKQHLETYAALNRIPYVALRFGTVCGHSPKMRIDTVLNGMYRSAVKNGVVRIANPQSSRPILGLTDLCRGIERILLSGGSSGVYNLSSFNTSFGEIAEAVKRRFPGVAIEPYESYTAYDMAMSCRKFMDEFEFEFKDSVDTILDELARQPSIEGSDRSEEGMQCFMKSAAVAAVAASA